MTARGRNTGRWSASRSRRAPEITDNPWEPRRSDTSDGDDGAGYELPPPPPPLRPTPAAPGWEPAPIDPPPVSRPSGEPAVDEFSPSRGLIAPPQSGRPVEPLPPPDDTRGGSKAEILRFFGELPVLIALALGIALLIKAFLVQPFYIEQESMEPTLHPAERVLVSKLNYRFGDPARGDVVIFHNPRDPCEKTPDVPACNPSLPRRMFDWIIQTFGLPTGTSDDLVKRIVALPGETIAMRDGEVYVCQTPGCQPLNPDGSPKDGLVVAFARTEVKGPQRDHDDIDAMTVPADQYYVLGDNRDGSVDSRVFGTVPRKDFVGKVVVLLWPPTRWQGL